MVDPYSVLPVVYAANILIAGYVGLSCLFYPNRTQTRALFAGNARNDHPLRLVGALWLAIALLSVLGLYFPLRMSPVLFIQLIYKFLWLVVCALPILMRGRLGDLPGVMTSIFLVYILVLGLTLPYGYLFGG